MAEYIHSALITEGANLLHEMIRSIHPSRLKRSGLGPRYMLLRPRLRALTDPYDVENELASKLVKRPGWRLSKEEMAAKRAGTYVHIKEPEVTIEQPREIGVYVELMNLINDSWDEVSDTGQFLLSDRLDAFKAKGAKLKMTYPE